MEANVVMNTPRLAKPAQASVVSYAYFYLACIPQSVLSFNVDERPKDYSIQAWNNSIPNLSN